MFILMLVIQKLLAILKENVHYRNPSREEETGLSSTWWIIEADLSRCRNFQERDFYFWELPESATQHGWATKKILISRSFKTPIFAFFLSTF